MTGPRPGMPQAPYDTSAMPSHVGASGARGGMYAGGGGGVPFSVADQGGAIQISPWWLYKGPSAQDFYLHSLLFNAIGGATTAVPNFTFTVANGNVGVIKFIEMTCQNSLASITLTVTLLINGAPVIGWTNIAFPQAQATALIIPWNGMDVRMNQGDTLTARATETFGTTYSMSLQASGWQVPRIEIDRLQNGINL